jgi:hypothetical protein
MLELPQRDDDEGVIVLIPDAVKYLEPECVGGVGDDGGGGAFLRLTQLSQLSGWELQELQKWRFFQMMLPKRCRHWYPLYTLA